MKCNEYAPVGSYEYFRRVLLNVRYLFDIQIWYDVNTYYPYILLH